ncbi:hypothetical protein GCM10010252_41740 [Streptomyces aureoverticillatus]|nr:hypothetical protein GCM10010252_41740 [Streptomyces aureoverticillatus]
MTTASRLPEPYPQQGGSNLADILERVLDKGIVIAGDIRINLLDIELLTIKLRLVVASVERAKEMGIDWWEDDPALSTGARRTEIARENEELRRRVEQLERRELELAEGGEATGDGGGESRARGARGARGERHDGRGERERDR